MTQDTETNPPVGDSQLRSALRWYMFGLGLLGVTVGYFAGSSQSPVVGALIPVLFGLVGGASGLYLAQVELRAPAGHLRLRLLGKAMALFTAMVFGGSVYGVALRTGGNVWSVLPSSLVVPTAVADLDELSGDAPEIGAELLTLRARLRGLGASIEEELFILTRTAAILRRAEPQWRRDYPYLEALTGAGDGYRIEGTDRLIAALHGGAVTRPRPVPLP